MIKKTYSTLLTAIISIAIHSQLANATLKKQCILRTPLHIKPATKSDPNDTVIHISSKNMISKYPHFIEYNGNVHVKEGKQSLKADEVKITQKKIKNQKPSHMIVAIGNVHYNNPYIILTGEKACSNINNKDTDIEKCNYLMVGRQGRGYANKIKLRKKNRYTILEDGMFTTCLPNNDDWNIMGSKVIFDYEKETAAIWNGYFRISNTPVFYTPYLKLPIGNKRRSGFLLPNASYSKNLGLEFSFPFYWNIAPNYDATIIPQFFGLQDIKINNEFRYLTTIGEGTISIDWLKENFNRIKTKNNKKKPTSYKNNDRWLLHWDHFGILNQVWRFNVNYLKASDSKYFIDFSSRYGNSADWYNTQTFSLSYTKPNWNATLTRKKFQVFTDAANDKTYKIGPKLRINYYSNHFGPFYFKSHAQVERINGVGAHNSNATRLYVEPELNLSLLNKWATINNIIKIMATYYNRDIFNEISDKNQKKQVAYILPSVSCDTNLSFERNLLINKNYFQTLEPRVQYLYVPHHNQNNIHNYDSSLLQTNYHTLFQTRVSNSIDPVNQLTAGITTRIYDKRLIEWLNFSIGQIYFFKQEKKQNFNISSANKNNTGSLLWVGDAYLRLTDHWRLRSKIQYDKRFGDLSNGNILIEYRSNSDRLLQLNYRFFYCDNTQTSNKNLLTFQKDISQIGAVVSWPLGNHWEIISSYYYNLKEKQTTSRLISLQYNTCCWSINIGHESKVVGEDQNFNNEYKNRWSINVGLKGLNNNYHSNNLDALSNGIIPYQETF